jgi:hypothetical protein
MKSKFTRQILVAALAIVALLQNIFADQGNMERALDALRNARAELSQASHDKGGHIPAAGPALAPRLLTAFGTDRDRFEVAGDLLNLSGIGPVRIARPLSASIEPIRNTMWFYAPSAIRPRPNIKSLTELQKVSPGKLRCWASNLTLRALGVQRDPYHRPSNRAG